MQSKNTQIEEFSQTMDPNNVQDLVKFQQLMSEWSALSSLQSSTVKTVRDAIQGVIQKM
ncbi:EscF/YscF/HrpA family type III secretion system needle major subunit [Vibrio sp. TBV020]|uniref:EscF/YscF/HrpA family type III secretion system needle major subunit n=1 Tax=Vibrio sp. TBV020 TaxID=3137398 RepID=UPI0038CD9AFE